MEIKDHARDNFLYTLLDFTISGQRFTLINDTEALTVGGDNYLPSAFKADLLPQPEKGLAPTNIVFSNVGAAGTVSELGELAFNSIQQILGEMIIIRRVFKADQNNILIETPLEVLQISITPKTVSIRAGFYNLYQQTIPRLYYDESTAPGLA